MLLKKIFLNTNLLISVFCNQKTIRRINNVILSDIPNINIGDIKKSFKSKGFIIRDGYTSITTKCPLCSNDKGKEERRLFINKTTGYFVCPHCQLYGEWNVLERLLKSDRSDQASCKYIDDLKRNNAMFDKQMKALSMTTSCIGKCDLTAVKEMFDVFELPFQEEIVKILSDVKIDLTKNILYFPLRNSADKIVDYKKLTIDDDLEDQRIPSFGLFTCRVARSVKEKEQAVLVTKLKDLLAMIYQKVPGTLVWWYSGVLPPSVLPILERYNRICIWPTCWEDVRCMADKLGNDRTFFVRPPEGLISPYEAFISGRSIRNMLAESKPASHKSITTFRSLRDDVYSELTNMDKVRGVKWSRFPSLVRLLGGHRRGELTVITGPTGCGKTTLCAEMSLDLAQQGVTTLWGSFEIRNSRLARTMLQQYAGVSLESNLHRFEEFADGFQKLPIYFLMFHGPQPIRVVMEAVEHAHYAHDISHVIIDNVQFMLGLEGGLSSGSSATSDRFAKQDQLVAAFRAFATRSDCHVTLVMHPRKERDAEDLSTSSIFGSAKASQEADNVLIIQDKRLTAIRGKKYLQVAKNRFSGDLGIVPLEFDKESLSYSVSSRKNKTQDESKTESHQAKGNSSS